MAAWVLVSTMTVYTEIACATQHEKEIPSQQYETIPVSTTHWK